MSNVDGGSIRRVGPRKQARVCVQQEGCCEEHLGARESFSKPRADSGPESNHGNRSPQRHPGCRMGRWADGSMGDGWVEGWVEVAFTAEE